MTDYRAQVIAEHYSTVPQIHKTREELAELHEALGDYLASGSTKDLHHVTEEICDVEVMLAQIKWLLGIHPDAIQDIKEYKLRRAMRDIEKTEAIPEATYGN